MIRRNIFQILSEQKDISTEFTHLDNFFKNRKVVRKGIGKEYSLKEFVELFCFDTWASNGYCVNLDEFLARVKYPHTILTAFCDDEDAVRDFLAAIETIYNLWYVAESFLSLEDTEGRHWDILPTFEMLKEMMNSQLTSINHKAVYSADKAQVIVVENDPAITAVVEVVDPHLVAPILQYNHHLLHGQLNEKKRILLTLGSNLEARRSDLKAANSTLESDIFFILDSLTSQTIGILTSEDYIAKETSAESQTETNNRFGIQSPNPMTPYRPAVFALTQKSLNNFQKKGAFTFIQMVACQE